MINKLKKQLPFNIISISFNQREGFKFLDIELDEKDLNAIEEKTQIILKALNQIDQSNDEYFLNVYSSGTEKEISKNNLNNHLEEYIHIKTSKQYLDKSEWEGHLKTISQNEIILLVNNKGRFQKLKIDMDDINYIKKTAKLSKERKNEQ